MSPKPGGHSDAERDSTAHIGAALWESGAAGLVVIDSGNIVDCNDRFASWLGRASGALEGQHLLDCLAPTDDASESSLHDTISGRHDSTSDVRLRTDVESHQVLELTSLALDDGKHLVCMCDVTEQRETARELRLWRGAIEDSLNGYNVVDASRHIVYANQAYIDMWGYESVDEVIGMSPEDHYADPDVPAKVIGDIDEYGRTTVEFKAKRKDGSTFDVLKSVQEIKDARGNVIYIGTSLDVSELKRLQKELVDLHRLEAIGGLAASLAHDFNNMLSPILGFSELMLRDETVTDSLREQVEQVHLAAERSRNLTGQLLAFSRRQVLEPRPIDMREAVTEIESLMRTSLREDTRLTLILPPEPSRVMVDRTQLNQILLNLVKNAQEAMSDGGVITIEVGQRDFDEEYCRDDVQITPGRFGELVVSDSGAGITPEVQERLFEPFFSTKGQSGTGLGLASVYGIVKQHGGNVWVYSEPEQGTAFKVYLPLTDEEPAAIEDKPISDDKGLRSGLVLLVEDDEMVRSVAKRILAKDGHEVITAGSCVEAREWLASTERAPDLLFTDVILPDGNGRELSEAFLERYSSLPVLYMSGYTDNVISRHGVLKEGVEFLQKPFSATELQGRVRDLL